MKRASQSAWRRGVYVAAAIVGLGVMLAAVPTTARAVCVGDCGGDCEVTVDEILTMVNLALNGGIAGCEAGDSNGDGEITVDEILTAVNNALNGCPPGSCGGAAACGNGVPETGEECDNGGICIGGSTAGNACTADDQCKVNDPAKDGGVCAGGAKILTSCTADSECPGSKCVYCKTFGGDGCAANCTLEHDVPYVLVPGETTDELGIVPGTSGAVVNGEILVIPLELTGSQVLTVGKEVDGQITGVIKVESINFPKIPVSTLACACVRGVAYKTCGGVLFNADGSLSPTCTEGFANPPAVCPENKRCAFVHGPGNTASGVIGCSGLEPVNVEYTLDCNATPGEPPLPPVLDLSGVGPAGSALVVNTLAIGTQIGECTDTFCTPDDPSDARGNPIMLINTTGRGSGKVLNPNDFAGPPLGPRCVDGADAGAPCAVDADCPGSTCGPLFVEGKPFSCSQVASGSLSGAELVSTFNSCDLETVGDIVVTVQFVGQ